jgi:hypothetical protein
MDAQIPALEEPWKALPPRIGSLIRPHVPALSDEVIAAIRERVPPYRRPLAGRFGAGIRLGVEEALAQFADLVSDPELDRSGRDAVYRGLGRGEFRERRSLDALLAAYRLGARVAWRRLASVAIEAGVDRRTLALLAEAVFAYIDELSALSVEGYAQEQSRAAGERDRLRRRVVELLLDPAVDEAAVRAAAAEAAWVAPETAAALVWRGSRSRLRARLPAGTPVLEGDEEGETTVAILADPEAPELADRLTRAAGRGPLVLGPTVELTAVGESAARARRVLALITNGAIEASGLVRAAEQLGALVAHGDEEALAELAGARLAPLEAETPASRRRLVETLRAWLDAQGEVAAVAARLHVHPQTVRYRMARLRELFGEALTDPEARLELALALRSPVSANM